LHYLTGYISGFASHINKNLVTELPYCLARL
jgi:hypothetical protein